MGNVSCHCEIEVAIMVFISFLVGLEDPPASNHGYCGCCDLLYGEAGGHDEELFREFADGVLLGSVVTIQQIVSLDLSLFVRSCLEVFCSLM
jgi:hypothetical protein